MVGALNFFPCRIKTKSFMWDNTHITQNFQKKYYTSSFDINETARFQILVQLPKQNVQLSAHSGMMMLRLCVLSTYYIIPLTRASNLVFPILKKVFLVVLNFMDPCRTLMGTPKME